MRTVALLLLVVVIFALIIGCTRPATTAAVTIAPVTTPADIAVPVPALTSVQAPGLLPAAVTTYPAAANNSGKGVWVRIGTAGEYTGTIGKQGSLFEVNGTGEHFYQVPAASTDIIEIYLNNLDTYGRVLSVEVFNNGEMVEQETIMTPKGTLAMTVNLKTVQLPRQVLPVTTRVTLVQPTPTGQGTPQPRPTETKVTTPQVISLSCNPQQEKVTVSKKTEMRDMEISNCAMGVLLPGIVGDSTYGLNGSKNSWLSGFSYGDIEKLKREASERQAAVNYCTGVIPTPYWHWIECKAMLQPGGFFQETYNVTFYANYESLKIPLKNSIDTFKPGQQYPYNVYIPIKAGQDEVITGFEFGFVPVTS